MKKYAVTQSIVASMIKDDVRVPVSLENGFILSFIKEREGISFFDVVQAYSNLMGNKVCLNAEQFNTLKPIETEVKADAEEVKEEPKYTLDPTKKYEGNEGIDYIILFLQNTDLSKQIERDDSNALFVDLGSIDMFPDANNMDWIMKLNARIPLKSAMSIGCKMKKGVKHFGIVLHDNFV